MGLPGCFFCVSLNLVTCVFFILINYKNVVKLLGCMIIKGLGCKP